MWKIAEICEKTKDAPIYHLKPTTSCVILKAIQNKLHKNARNRSSSILKASCPTESVRHRLKAAQTDKGVNLHLGVVLLKQQ
ncbi:hypothetical protein EVA_15945 [gut metagenome]|uniref:Uncharacterized protein n=1 Tax=gut metagenome TaxID=749906 RepID=J9FNB4_9ZZZZ